MPVVLDVIAWGRSLSIRLPGLPSMHTIGQHSMRNEALSAELSLACASAISLFSFLNRIASAGPAISSLNLVDATKLHFPGTMPCGLNNAGQSCRQMDTQPRPPYALRSGSNSGPSPAAIQMKCLATCDHRSLICDHPGRRWLGSERRDYQRCYCVRRPATLCYCELAQVRVTGCGTPAGLITWRKFVQGGYAPNRCRSPVRSIALSSGTEQGLSRSTGL